MSAMLKAQAIELLGGTAKSAAAAIGVTSQAISGWPDVLTPALRDRVQAALYRQKGKPKRKAKPTEAREAV
jgi:hypothetical protein